MTQRYIIHFSTILLIHAVLILGGFKLFQTEFVQSRLNETVVQLKFAEEAIKSSVENFVAPKKVTQNIPVPKRVESSVVESETQSEVVEAASAPTQSTASGTYSEDILDLYRSELRTKIDQNKSYPSMSKRLGQQGEVMVSFTVLANGKIANIKIDSASRFEALNKAALEAVKSVKKFRPIPKELGMEKMDVRIPIRYSLNR